MYRNGSSFYGGSSMFRYNFGGTNNTLQPWNEYEYGRNRRRPYYWDRDRFAYNRLWRNLRRRRRRRNASREDSPEPEPPKPEPPKPEPPKEEIVKELTVKNVNLNIKENTEKSNTDVYECTEDDRENDENGQKPPPELVVRRGNFMKLSVTFDRPYDKEKHDLKLCFSIGKDPSVSKGSMAQFKIDEDGKKSYDPFKWGAYLDSRSGNDIDVMVHIAADCIVGEWNLTMKTICERKDENGKDDPLVLSYKHDEDVVILFNPWCKDDGVFMETTDLLNEYILNENGCVYQGNAWTRGAKPWNFGQFEDGNLDICLYLLRSVFKNGISKKMADPIYVSRIIAQLVNSSDENGVLEGRWNGDYDDGTPPTSWVGSPRILKQFMKSGPVKYGQCWVFSCLTTTVCRCLGIPCRTVTNFASAHDTDESNLIEKVFVENNGKLEKVKHNHDSVWNFHVWNEVWLARDDLKEQGEFNGWQVIDATPQETSDNVYTCGPCPVAAVKNGRVDVKFDASFVFSEVNADEAHFKLHPDGTYEKLELLTDKIGKCISTKIPDGKPFKDSSYGEGGMRFDRNAYDEKKREDITREYKYPEGSEEERKAVEKAFGIAKDKKRAFASSLHRPPILDPYTVEPVIEKVEFKLNHSNEVMIGSGLHLEVVAKNLGKRTHQIYYIQLQVSPKSYTGDIGEIFFERYFDGVQLVSGQETMYKALITPEDYFPHLVEQANLYIEVYGVVGSPSWGPPHQETTKSHDFRFRRPDLDIKGPKTGVKGESVEFKVSFKNPAPVALTNCTISMGSSGFKDIEDQKQADIPVGGTYEGKFKMTPKRNKEHEVVFSFDCNELKDISGSTSIVISKD